MNYLYMLVVVDFITFRNELHIHPLLILTGSLSIFRIKKYYGAIEGAILDKNLTGH